MKHAFHIFSLAIIFVLSVNLIGCPPIQAEAASAWETVGVPGFSAGMAGYPSLAVDNGIPYVAYVDGDNGNRASVMKFDGTSWVAVGASGFSVDAIDHPSLAVDNGTLYVAYQDWGNAGKATVMKFDGSAWVAVGTPGFSAEVADTPSLALDNGIPYIAYEDWGSGGKATVMKFDGSAWVTVGASGFSAAVADTLSLAVDNDTLYISYRDWSSNGRATVMTFDVLSGNWVTVGSLGFTAKTATYLSLAVDNGTPYVVYQDGDHSAKATAMKFDGSAWVTVGLPGFSAGRANYLSLAIVNGVLYVAYQDYAKTYKASVMKFDGTNWIAVGAPGFSAGQAVTPAFFINNDTLYVAYQDYPNNDKATVMRFVNDTTPPGAPVVTAPPALIADRSPVILGTAEPNSLINVWYFDDANNPVQICQNTPVDVSGNWSCESSGELPERAIELKVNATDESGNTSGDTSYSFTIDLTTWEVVGTAGISNEAAWFTSLAVDHGTPYVAYMDWDKGNKATVMKFDGNDWVAVGTPGFSAGNASLTSIALDSGVPYVAYLDGNNYSTATVMKFDALSGNWITVGAEGFSPRYLNELAFAIDNGIPYVAYTGQTNGYKASVMKYDTNSGNWVTVGTAGFSAGEADYISLAVDNGTPYVAYADHSDGSGKATVMKFDTNSGNWVTIGTAGFSAGEANALSLVVDNGTPYVAYADHSDGSGKATVMKFDGSIWSPVGVPGFSAGTAFQTSLVVDNGTPYVAYKDWSDKGRAIVAQFDALSGEWISVGAADFSNDYVDYLSFAVENGIPYVAYKDLGNAGKASVMRLSDRTRPNAPAVTTPPDFTNDSTPAISGTAEPESLINVSYFDDSNNQILVCQDVQVDGSGDWSCVSSAMLPEREIELTVDATDHAGNISSDTSYLFTIDLTDPDAPVVNAPTGATHEATPTISGTAEPESLINVLYRDGAGWVPACQSPHADGFGVWSCVSSLALPKGRIELAVNATDAAGNQSANRFHLFTLAVTDHDAPGVNVYIHGDVKGNHALAPNAGARQSYETVNNGPVKITGTNTFALIGSERVIYKVNGVNTSFSEMMALPDHQLDNTYWLPWYNNVGLDTQLRLGNVSGSTAHVHVYIGTDEMNGSPLTLTAGGSTRLSFSGVNNGPVKIESDQNIVASQRIIYRVNKTQTSFTEMMALPDSQLNTTYWLPWYNNVDLDTQLRFGNVSNNIATVHVYIGTDEMPGSPFTLQPGESTRQSFAGVNNGPVRIESDQNVVASERIIYKVKSVPTSFTEMMALPDSQLNTTYWLPWYNSKDLDTQLRFGNVSNNVATVHVYIGGVEMAGSPFTLVPGESTRQSFPTINNGPVKIESDQNIAVSERVVYKVKGVPTSFTEMMALPDSQLNTTYWLPWYNNVDLDTQLRFGIP